MSVHVAPVTSSTIVVAVAVGKTSAVFSVTDVTRHRLVRFAATRDLQLRRPVAEHVVAAARDAVIARRLLAADLVLLADLDQIHAAETALGSLLPRSPYATLTSVLLVALPTPSVTFIALRGGQAIHVEPLKYSHTPDALISTSW